MNIVKPYARLLSIDGHSPELNSGLQALSKIEWCGRISHRSEEAQTEDSWKRFIQAVVIEKGDWSIAEHASATVDMLVDRGITHEVVRHRLFSFTQESTRFVNYAKKMPASFVEPEGLDGVQLGTWRATISRIEEQYQSLVNSGLSPQIARSILPNGLASRIIITGNLRNWRHFFIMRTTQEAHPQMREIAIPLLEEFRNKIPLLYDDIIPLTKQRIGMEKGR